MLESDHNNFSPELYVTMGMVQETMTRYYLQTGHKLDFLAAVKELINHKRFLPDKPVLNEPFENWSHISDDEFASLLSQLPINLGYFTNNLFKNDSLFSEGFPADMDVATLVNLCHTSEMPHVNDYFELMYVFRGFCRLKIDKNLNIMQGEICILPPQLKHAIIVDDPSSVILSIAIRRSTFESVFKEMLMQKTLLASYFRMQLFREGCTNHIRLATSNSSGIKFIFKNLVIDSYTMGIQSNLRCISWMNLLFTEILRGKDGVVKNFTDDSSDDILQILQYIQQHYRTITLKALAERFHYQPTHLSLLIKKSTGSRYIDLVTRLKMTDSVNYLKNTDIAIDRIAELVGYNSTDHFSATFKKQHGASPSNYRKLIQADRRA